MAAGKGFVRLQLMTYAYSSTSRTKYGHTPVSALEFRVERFAYFEGAHIQEILQPHTADFTE